MLRNAESNSFCGAVAHAFIDDFEKDPPPSSSLFHPYHESTRSYMLRRPFRRDTAFKDGNSRTKNRGSGRRKVSPAVCADSERFASFGGAGGAENLLREPLVGERECVLASLPLSRLKRTPPVGLHKRRLRVGYAKPTEPRNALPRLVVRAVPKRCGESPQ